MARALRIPFPGAIYHMMSRGTGLGRATQRMATSLETLEKTI
ncbi:MAG: hypothetical protein O3C60_00015 [Planctomycetota bacterium]|nr:hypothetical protein [Planctomycetota bacterium]